MCFLAVSPNGTVNSYKLILRRLQKKLRGLKLLKQTSLSFLPRRPLVLVMVNLMLKLTDTSESFGLPATADLMFALISTDEAGGVGTNYGEAVEESL